MNELSVADIAALNGRDGNGGFGGDSGAWWLLVLFALLGGFGNGGWGGGYGGVGGNELYPWLNQAQLTTQGFADQNAVMAMNGIQQGITSGFGDIQNALCSGFAGVNAGIASGFATAEASATARQMANMQQAFGLSQQFSDCCCENRLATANQTATILAEHCADRNALSEGVRDIIASQTAGTQRIIDQLCQDKIDAKNDEIAQLRQQVQMQNLAASQQAQTAQILADNFAQTNALEQYLAPVPRPAYVVQNPNCCQQTFGCGCAA